MKKIISMFLILILVLGFSGCKSSKVIEDNSSTNSISEYSEMLINTNLLSSISIHNVYDEELVKIPVKEDWAFLSKYTKSHTLPKEENHKLLAYPDTHIIHLNISTDYEEIAFEKVYLFDDGSIAKGEMSGDMGVTHITYDIYVAEEKYMLNEKKLITLLKKYDNSITHME